MFSYSDTGNRPFHVQKLAYDAISEERLGGEKYIPVLPNGDTLKQLLARSRYLLFKSAEKWTETQKARSKILFDRYQDIK